MGISYHVNSEDGVFETTYTPADENGNAVIAGSPSRKGYSFLGWAKLASANKAEYKPGETIDLQGRSINLYAVWGGTLTYDANGGSGAPEDVVTDRGIVTLSTVEPTQNGVTFLGWNEDKEATKAAYQPGDSFNLVKDTKLYAIWGWALVYNANSDDVNNVPKRVEGKGDITISSQKPTRNHYTFLGWADTPDADSA